MGSSLYVRSAAPKAPVDKQALTGICFQESNLRRPDRHGVADAQDACRQRPDSTNSSERVG
jgi:hypothetical protein